MATLNQPLNDAIARIIDLHRLSRKGEADTASYETVCEELDAVWSNVAEEESKWLRNLSGDLYVTEGTGSSHHLSSDISAQVRGEVLRKAWQGGDWEAILALLRTNVQLDREQVAFLRGLAYLRLGVPLVAFEFAKDLFLDAPDDGNAMLAIDASMHLPTNGASVQVARLILTRQARVLFVTASAAFYLVRSLPTLDEEGRRQFVEDAPALLEEAIERNLQSTENERYFANLVLGVIQSASGHSEGAVEAYREALAINPTMDALTLLASEGINAKHPQREIDVTAFKNDVNRLAEEEGRRILAIVA